MPEILLPGMRNCLENRYYPSKTEAGQIHLFIVTALWSPWKSTPTKEDLMEWEYFTGSMPLLTPVTVLIDVICLNTLSFATNFNNCGVNTGSEVQEHCILGTN